MRLPIAHDQNNQTGEIFARALHILRQENGLCPPSCLSETHAKKQAWADRLARPEIDMPKGGEMGR